MAVMCAFSGEWIEENCAVELSIRLPGELDCVQTIFVKANELVRLVVPNIPLLPELLEMAGEDSS